MRRVLQFVIAGRGPYAHASLNAVGRSDDGVPVSQHHSKHNSSIDSVQEGVYGPHVAPLSADDRTLMLITPLGHTEVTAFVTALRLNSSIRKEYLR